MARWMGGALGLAALSVACGSVSASSPTPSIGSLPTFAEPAVSTATSTAPATTIGPTTTAAPRAEDCPGRLVETAVESVPDGLVQRLEFVLADPVWSTVEVSASIWVDGYGEIVAVGADDRLLPASNQKLFTGIGAQLLLDDDQTFTTEVHRRADALVLVGGGDPTLAATGPHSLQALARQVAASGVERVDAVLVDATRFESATAAPGWQQWQMPAYVGPMSALMVDDNRHRVDRQFIADPALGNGELFAELLRAEGVAVSGPVVHGSPAPASEPIAQLESVPVAALTRLMLLGSDNEVAESLLREIGAGSTVDGAAGIDGALAGWCVELHGATGDGSGLSRANRRSAREWRVLLQIAATQPWGGEFRAALPTSGRSGTLARRLTGPEVIGRVEAKTGSIIGGRALSGYATTAAGRQVVFSIITNGDRAASSRWAIDGLITAVVTPLG